MSTKPKRDPEQQAAVDRAYRDASDGPPAKPARAREIALMDEFGLEEFVELTGVGIGNYGIYCISSDGVSVPAQKNLAALTAKAQSEVHKFARRASLEFPCTPGEFMQWYNATRGEPDTEVQPAALGVSDFPLAKGFFEELKRYDSSAASSEPSVPSGDIIAAFRVKLDSGANFEWWDRRLRDPGRYKLKAARAGKGGAKRPSRWYPVHVATWLIQQKHLPREPVLRAMQAKFEAWDADLL